MPEQDEADETLVDVRSGSDVQINRQTWVSGRIYLQNVNNDNYENK